MDPVSAALPQNLRRIFVATLPELSVSDVAPVTRHACSERVNTRAVQINCFNACDWSIASHPDRWLAETDWTETTYNGTTGAGGGTGVFSVSSVRRKLEMRDTWKKSRCCLTATVRVMRVPVAWDMGLFLGEAARLSTKEGTNGWWRMWSGKLSRNFRRNQDVTQCVVRWKGCGKRGAPG